MSSVTRVPWSSCVRVASSRSEANCANAASSRYWASASFTPPDSFLMILVWAAPPTRDTETPAFTAGRMPALNRSVSRKIWPSVIEITLVGTNAETSPAWVSMIGSAVSVEPAHDVRDGARLLPDRDVDAGDAGVLLVDDRVDRERGLAGLAVADDQLALAAPDRDHRVHRLVAGLHRLRHGLAPDHARRDLLDGRGHLGGQRGAAVDRLAERVHHAAAELGADRHLEDAARGLHRVALAQVLVVAEHHRADRVALEAQRP